MRLESMTHSNNCIRHRIAIYNKLEERSQVSILWFALVIDLYRLYSHRVPLLSTNVEWCPKTLFSVWPLKTLKQMIYYTLLAAPYANSMLFEVFFLSFIVFCLKWFCHISPATVNRITGANWMRLF